MLYDAIRADFIKDFTVINYHLERILNLKS